MKLKPGKYVQRDGGIATVAAVDETKALERAALGWDSDGDTASWTIDGIVGPPYRSHRDLIREYREPREFWLVAYQLHDSKESAEKLANTDRHKFTDIIHLREVIE